MSVVPHVGNQGSTCWSWHTDLLSGSHIILDLDLWFFMGSILWLYQTRRLVSICVPVWRNVKTGTSIYQRPSSAFRNDSTDLSCPRRLSNGFRNDSTDLSCPRRLSNGIQRLDRISAYQHQTSSCISTTRPTPATLVERPAAKIYNATISISLARYRLAKSITSIFIELFLAEVFCKCW